MTRPEINLKKIFVFSSIETKNIIDGGIEMESKPSQRTGTFVPGRTNSAVIEQHLMEAFLPPHPVAAHVMKQLYLEEISVGEALQQLFNHCAGGVYGHAKQRETQALVDYTYTRLNRYHYIEKVPDGDWEYFKKNVSNLLAELEKDTEENDDKEMKEEISAIKVTLTYNTAEDFFIDVNYMNNLFHFISVNWDLLNDTQVTYKILASVTKFISWEDTSDDILDLRDVLMEITPSWNI